MSDARPPAAPDPVEGEDYYFDAAGLLVMTEASHLRRGTCCGNRCRHCPYEYSAVVDYPTPAGALSVRAAGAADAAAIAGVGRQTFAATFGEHFAAPGRDLVPYLDRTFSVGKVASGLASPGNAWWVSVDAVGTVWGFAKLKVAEATGDGDAPGLQLQKLYLRRPARGLGAGGALLTVAEARAAALGAGRVWLTVLRENSAAVAFYQGRGYRVVGDARYAIGGQGFRFRVMGRRLKGGHGPEDRVPPRTA